MALRSDWTCLIPLNARAAVDRVDANMIPNYRRIQRGRRRKTTAIFGVVGKKDDAGFDGRCDVSLKRLLPDWLEYSTTPQTPLSASLSLKTATSSDATLSYQQHQVASDKTAIMAYSNLITWSPESNLVSRADLVVLLGDSVTVLPKQWAGAHSGNDACFVATKSSCVRSLYVPSAALK